VRSIYVHEVGGAGLDRTGALRFCGLSIATYAKTRAGADSSRLIQDLQRLGIVSYDHMLESGSNVFHGQDCQSVSLSNMGPSVAVNARADVELQCKERRNMNATLIIEAARKTLAGKISFPEVVGQLLTAGVEYYHVDYVGLKKTFYSADGDMVVTPINYEELPRSLRSSTLPRFGQTFWIANGTISHIATSPVGRWRQECKATSPSCAASG
jgi:uncharacterized protein YbcV (DUF1398 family)